MQQCGTDRFTDQRQKSLSGKEDETHTFYTMAGTILENLSAKKLTILVSALMVCQLVCFLIGGLIGKSGMLCTFGGVCNVNYTYYILQYIVLCGTNQTCNPTERI